jgi:hypothetical protein
MWTAHYCDGTSQKDGSYRDIDQSKIVRFVVEQGGQTLLIDIPKGWRLIYRERFFGSPQGQTSIHIAGAQATDKSGKQFISILYPDGRILTTDRFRDDIAELRSPQLLDGEEWDF